jgi:hypothetical protein
MAAALIALLAAVDYRPDGHHLPNLIAANFTANLTYPANNFVPGNAGINGRPPLFPVIPGLMQIAVAHPDHRISIATSLRRKARRSKLKGTSGVVALSAA